MSKRILPAAEGRQTALNKHFALKTSRKMDTEFATCSRTSLVSSPFNPLITKLSCWNFNLVNADHFSREYLVCLLCYRSQICVLLRQWVAAIAHTQVGRYAFPTSKVKPIKCNDLIKLCSKLVLWGWLLKSTYKILAVVLVSAKCSPDHRECAKMCFPSTLKP